MVKQQLMLSSFILTQTSLYDRWIVKLGLFDWWVIGMRFGNRLLLTKGTHTIIVFDNLWALSENFWILPEGLWALPKGL